MPYDLGQVGTLHLPLYLCAESKKDLLSEIRAFPKNKPFYSLLKEHNFLQGDYLKEVIIFDQNTGERTKASALIVSNSCDINLENPDRFSRNIVVTPIIKLHKFVQLLEENGKSAEQIQSTIDALRSQEISHIFYLPPSQQHVDEESFVLLDNLHSLPVSAEIFEKFERAFSLSQFGHYLFLIKLSIHFTRLWESYDRLLDRRTDSSN